ncbi:MAG: gamma-glutamyl-gamma-aminobutyrate hydrolase family protein [Candidatus Berkiella sp.]
MLNRANAPLNQTAFNQLILGYQSSTSFSNYLLEQGFSPTIENISIEILDTQKIDFSDCEFKNVTFTGNLQHALFDHVSFNHVNFDHANLSSSIFSDVAIEHSTFSDSVFNKATFNNATMSQNKVYNCDFSNGSFTDSSINKTIFAKSKFENTLDFQNNLFDNHIVFNQQYQNDYVFQNSNKHLISPTVVIVDDPDWHDTPYYILKQYGANPVSVARYDEDINDYQLSKEVLNVIRDIKANGLKDSTIAEQVINSEQPLIKSIHDYAHHIMSSAQALWIPGGPDVHPEFYNESNTASYPSYSYYREILEFSLAQAAIEMNKPIIGICHGSQLMNVYLGGTLFQHIDTPSGHVLLTSHKQDGLIGSVIDDNLIGPSYHHQAVKDVAKSLEVVATSRDGVIKATQAIDGKSIMLCQFHPEYQADKSSVNILNQFVNISAEQNIKSKAIELADVLDLNHDIAGLGSSPIQSTSNTVGTTCAHECHVIEHLPSYTDPVFAV